MSVQENACDTHRNAVTKTVVGTTLIGKAIAGGRPQEMTPGGCQCALTPESYSMFFVKTSLPAVVMKEGSPKEVLRLS